MTGFKGPDNSEVSAGLDNLGWDLGDWDDLVGAKACYGRALAIWEAQLGDKHPQVAIGSNNLGSVLRDLGDFDGARAHFERALAFAQDHGLPAAVAAAQFNLGLLYLLKGELAEAEATFWASYAPWEQPSDRSFAEPGMDVVNMHPLPNTSYRGTGYDMGTFMAKHLKLRAVRDGLRVLRTILAERLRTRRPADDPDAWRPLISELAPE